MNTKRRKATLLPLIEAQIARLEMSLPRPEPNGSPHFNEMLGRRELLHPRVSLAYENIRGQIAALREIQALLTGERKEFSE